MKNKLLILLLLSCFELPVFSQFLDKKFYLLDSLNPKAIHKNDKHVMDSLLSKYHLSKTDTGQIAILNYLVETIFDEKIWMRYNQLALDRIIPLQKKYTEGALLKELMRQEALALNNIGYYHFNYADNLDEAMRFYKQALSIQERLNNYREMVVCYSNMANTYQNKGELLKAFAYFKKATDLDSVVKNKTAFLAPLNNMAQMYLYVGDTSNALLNLKKCLAISLHDNSDKNMKAHLLHNIGLLSHRTGDKTGVASVLKSLKLREDIGDKKGIVQSLLALSSFQLENKRPDLCKAYLDRIAAILPELKGGSREAIYYSRLSDYYEFIKDEKRSLEAAEQSVQLFKEMDVYQVDLIDGIHRLLKLYDKNPSYTTKKLHLYELLYDVEKTLQTDEARKISMKQNYEQSLNVQEAEFKAQQAVREEKAKSEKRKQNFIIYGVLLILAIVLLFSFFLFKALTRIKKSNQIISFQKKEVEQQKQIIEEKHKDITDSITYAHRIQSSLIPTPQQLQAQYAKISVLFQPRDIVSGDFYWYTQQNNHHVLALADCTGHGVPGAFMSILGINQLHTLVNEKQLSEPHLVLHELRKGIIASLNANSNEPDKRDGMDMALIYFDAQHLRFAGANLSVYIWQHNQLLELKGERQPIGISEKQMDFTTQHLDLQRGNRIFMLSDGLPDQFGGQGGKKLKIKTVKEWIIETLPLSLHEQRKAIAERLMAFKTKQEQTDDITLVSIEI